MSLTPADPASVGMARDLGARLDSIVSAGIAQGAAPGVAVAVGRWGRLVHLRGYGRIDIAPDAPAVTDSTLFDMASLTKVVATTTAAMILEDEAFYGGVPSAVGSEVRKRLDAELHAVVDEFKGRFDK